MLTALMLPLALLQAAAVPAPPPQPRIAIVPVAAAEQASTRFEAVNRLMLFRTRFGGRAVWALIDNGAGRSMLDVGLAHELGLTLGKRGVALTPTGSVPFWQLPATGFLIPTQATITARYVAIDMAAMAKTGRRIEAVLGGDLLRDLILIVDPNARSFRLVPPSARVPEGLAANTVPVIDKSRIDVVINGKRARLTIDLGANGGIALTPAAWVRVGHRDAVFDIGTTMHAEGDTYEVQTTRLPSMAIGALTVTDVDTTVRTLPAQAGDGMIGMGVLGRYAMTLDLPRDRLSLHPLR